MLSDTTRETTVTPRKGGDLKTIPSIKKLMTDWVIINMPKTALRKKNDNNTMNNKKRHDLSNDVNMKDGIDWGNKGRLKKDMESLKENNLTEMTLIIRTYNNNCKMYIQNLVIFEHLAHASP